MRYMAFQYLLNIVVIVAECFTSFYDFQYPNVTTLCLFWTVCECSCFEFFLSVVQFCLYGTLIIINSLNVYEAHMVDMQPARVSQPAKHCIKMKNRYTFFVELFFCNNLRFIYECWLAGWRTDSSFTLFIDCGVVVLLPLNDGWSSGLLVGLSFILSVERSKCLNSYAN